MWPDSGNGQDLRPPGLYQRVERPEHTDGAQNPADQHVHRNVRLFRAILNELHTEDEHQNRHSGQTGQTYGERHRLADYSQSAKDEVADAVRLEVGVFQLKHDRAVRRHTEIRCLRVTLLGCLRAAGAKPARLVA